MSASTFATTTPLNTDALFRAAAQQIHDAISARGWVNTSDTGQINLTTVTSAQNSNRGYEIWRTNDAKTTVYLKLQYFQDNSSGREIRLWFQFGTGTNGAGTLTGRTSIASAQFANVTPGTGTFNSYCSGDTNRLAIGYMIDHTDTRFAHLMVFERIKDVNGDDTDTGYIVGGGANASGGWTWQVVYFDATLGAVQDQALFPAILTMNTTSVYGSTIYAARVVPIAGQPLYPCQNLLAYTASDFTSYTQYTFTVDGGSKTYVALGAFTSGGNGSVGTVAVQQLGRLLMRYD